MDVQLKDSMERPFVFINVAMTADGKIDTVARKGSRRKVNVGTQRRCAPTQRRTQRKNHDEI